MDNAELNMLIDFYTELLSPCVIVKKKGTNKYLFSTYEMDSTMNTRELIQTMLVDIIEQYNCNFDTGISWTIKEG